MSITIESYDIAQFHPIIFDKFVFVLLGKSLLTFAHKEPILIMGISSIRREAVREFHDRYNAPLI